MIKDVEHFYEPVISYYELRQEPTIGIFPESKLKTKTVFYELCNTGTGIGTESLQGFNP